MHRLRVAAIEDVAEGVRSFTLVARDGGPLAPWTPGAHIDIELPGGERRQYSLCSDPAELDRYRIAVLRVDLPTGRGGSCWLHNHVAVGDELAVGDPRNTFALPAAARYLLLAGGIGITPLAAMAVELERRGADWQLVHGGRTRRAMALADELVALASDRVTLIAEDAQGRPALDALLADEPGLAVMCCGPAAMLSAVIARCAGWSAATLHIERFGAAAAGAMAEPRGAASGATAGGETAGGATTGDDAFEVELARSGLRLHVAGDQTLLAALHRAGVDHPCSCELGICGTCEVPVLAGAVDHRDELLTADERAANRSMMACVSRAAGPGLVLDL